MDIVGGTWLGVHATVAVGSEKLGRTVDKLSRDRGWLEIAGCNDILLVDDGSITLVITAGVGIHGVATTTGENFGETTL